MEKEIVGTSSKVISPHLDNLVGIPSGTRLSRLHGERANMKSGEKETTYVPTPIQKATGSNLGGNQRAADKAKSHQEITQNASSPRNSLIYSPPRLSLSSISQPGGQCTSAGTYNSLDESFRPERPNQFDPLASLAGPSGWHIDNQAAIDSARYRLSSHPDMWGRSQAYYSTGHRSESDWSASNDDDEEVRATMDTSSISTRNNRLIIGTIPESVNEEDVDDDWTEEEEEEEEEEVFPAKLTKNNAAIEKTMADLANLIAESKSKAPKGTGEGRGESAGIEQHDEGEASCVGASTVSMQRQLEAYRENDIETPISASRTHSNSEVREKLAPLSLNASTSDETKDADHKRPVFPSTWVPVFRRPPEGRNHPETTIPASSTRSKTVDREKFVPQSLNASTSDEIEDVDRKRPIFQRAPVFTRPPKD